MTSCFSEKFFISPLFMKDTFVSQNEYIYVFLLLKLYFALWFILEFGIFIFLIKISNT